MSDDRYSPDELPAEWPEGIVGAEEQGVRVFWLAAATIQHLVNRLALVLGEHMASGDELHVTYNAMQSGFRQAPPARDGSQWTDLYFEYSAFVVLRPHAQARCHRPRQAADRKSRSAVLAQCALTPDFGAHSTHGVRAL